MGILQNKNTRTIILVMVVLVVVSIVVSKLYYSNVNKAVDPRVVSARELYGTYNDIAITNNFVAVLALLDSVESIYSKIPHYKQSFEIGVIANNRAAVYLTLSLYKDSMNFDNSNKHFALCSTDSLLDLSHKHIFEAIYLYETWDSCFSGLSNDECNAKIRGEFLTGLEDYSEEDQEKYLKNRVKALVASQNEINRRLSVSYTNLGIIYRQQENYDSAVLAYAKAIELWDRNITAENNLNILLGKPLIKHNVIQKLFPPEKD